MGLLLYRSTPLACGSWDGKSKHRSNFSYKFRAELARYRKVASKGCREHRQIEDQLRPATHICCTRAATTRHPGVHQKQSHCRNSYGNSCWCSRNTKILHDRNRSHISPVPREKPEMFNTKEPVSIDKPLTPVKSLPSPCVSSWPKRLIKPSVRLQESLGVAWLRRCYMFVLNPSRCVLFSFCVWDKTFTLLATLKRGRCCVSVNFGLRRVYAIGINREE